MRPNTQMSKRVKEFTDQNGGTFYPVHPTHETVLGVKCYPTIADVVGTGGEVFESAPRSWSESSIADGFILQVLQRRPHASDVSSDVCKGAGFADHAWAPEAIVALLR
jgi:predicted CoA-binding protein